MRFCSYPATTVSFGRRAGASLLQSARTADAICRPLNTFVTVHLGQLGSSPETVFHDFADLRSRWFQRWSSNEPKGYRRNGPPTYAYVHENETGLPHTHWMVHVHPLNRPRFVRQLTRWLLKRFDLKSLPPGVLQVKDVCNAEGLKLYFAKNLDPRFAQLWGIRWEEGGPIAYRRADVSRNLGPAVWGPRKAAYKASRREASGGATVAGATASRGHAAPIVPGPQVPAHVRAPEVPVGRNRATMAAFQVPQGPPDGRCSPSPLGS